MRTVIYARKSTEQDDRQAQSLDDQLRHAREIARREGLTVVETITESRSAKVPGGRPEFQRMVSMIEEGKAEAILCWAPNRLSRNPVDGGILAYLLQTGKLRQIRTNDRTYRPEDSSLLLAIENATSTDYVRNLKKDVERGMRGKAERGWHACKAPLGYLNDAETRQIVIDPQRFGKLREAWELLLTGRVSVAEIHRKLVADGMTVHVRRGRAAGAVSQSVIYGMFRSRTYLGEVPYLGEYFPGKHPPMVTEQEFAQAQTILGPLGRGKKPEKNALDFSGVFRCAVCGCAIIGEQRRKHYPRSRRTAVYTYYHCSGSKGCSRKSIREEDLIDAAEKTVSKIKMTAGTAAWVSQALTASLENEAVGTAESLADLDRLAETEEKRMGRLRIMRLEGEVSAVEYADLRAEILGQQAETRERIHNARNLAGQVMRLISMKLDACVQSGQIENLNRDPKVLARILRLAGNNLLNLFPFEYQLDPILTKIAVFEPLRDSSEKPESGDSLTLFPVWWRLVEELRNLAIEELKAKEARRAAITYQARRWDRNNGWDP